MLTSVCARMHASTLIVSTGAPAVFGRRVVSVASSCVLCIQLVVTSPNRTGSHALLIQSPPSSRAIEPISEDIALCRAPAHPLSRTLFRLRRRGTFWHPPPEETIKDTQLMMLNYDLTVFQQAYSCSSQL